MSEAGDLAEDDGRAFLLHPALERFYPPEKRIVIPERMTECGGVMLADALDALAAEVKRVGAEATPPSGGQKPSGNQEFDTDVWGNDMLSSSE